jgi:DNA-binding beta-propeller fold protein YncE
MAEAFRGSSSKEINSPYGLARDGRGRLYVVDNIFQAVHVFDTEDNRYYRFPERSLDGFEHPIGVASGTADRIYISDSVGARVHVFEDGGKIYKGSIGEGLLQRPTGLSVNHHTGELLVLDTSASRLLVFDERDLLYKRTVGDPQAETENSPIFHYPTNISVSQEGRVYVSDSLNFRVQALSSDLEAISTFGAPGDTPGNFSRPKGVATDSDGHVYVIDALFDNVQVFNDQGELLLAFGGPGNAPGKFWLPNAIHIDSQDRIYVSDAYNKRVQVFQYLKTEENME